MPSAEPPSAKVLYKEDGEGWSLFSPSALNGRRPWNLLMRVQSANLETTTSKPWKIHLGDIVTVCVRSSDQLSEIPDSQESDDSEDDFDEDPKAYAKVSDLRCLGDGRYMVVYTWLYTREEILAELPSKEGLAMLQTNWPETAPFDYMLSTNRTATLWDTAITRAPESVVSRICPTSVYVTRRFERYIADIDDERLEWMREIFYMRPSL
ncbi:hypothetical protein BJX64DRAFT_54243 [Aspergillus heterothallicus]